MCYLLCLQPSVNNIYNVVSYLNYPRYFTNNIFDTLFTLQCNAGRITFTKQLKNIRSYFICVLSNTSMISYYVKYLLFFHKHYRNDRESAYVTAKYFYLLTLI